MFKSFLTKMWVEAQNNNIDNIISLLEKSPKARVLDIGCGDGQQTLMYKKKITCKLLDGVDGVAEKLEVAKKRRIKTFRFDLEKRWKLPSNTYDVLVSNQVIEHILDLDNFIKEAYRVLKPGGYFVVSTENLSSWHNIFALMLGFQDFSHHLLKKAHVGNPFALHNLEQTCSWSNSNTSKINEINFPHIKIPTYISMIRMFEAYAFDFVKGMGSGYYPLIGTVSVIASRIDPFHSHFIALKFTKPKSNNY